jgi:non-heme chloroperoxidase
MDMRGHGESDWAPDGNYRVEAYVEDLRIVLMTFTTPPAVVGASLGGIATLLAAGEAETFKGRAVILVDIAPRIEREGALRILRFMTGRPDGFENLEEAAEVIAAFTPHRVRAVDLEGLEKNLRRGADGRYRWHWDPRFISATGPAEVLDQKRMIRAARGLNLPTLLVRGRESDVLSEQGAAELLEAIPSAEYVDVSGAGHMVAGDRNDAFTEAVRTFLDRRLPIKAAV